MTSPFGSPPERPDELPDPRSQQTPPDPPQGEPLAHEADRRPLNGPFAAADSFATGPTAGPSPAADEESLFAGDLDEGAPGQEDVHSSMAPDELAGAPAEVEDAGDAGEAGESARRFRRVTWEILQTIVLAGLIFLLVRGVAQNFRVEGPSMEPGLQNGQYLLVNKAVYFKLNLDNLSKFVPFINGGNDPSKYLFHAPDRGDVIVFRYPKDPSRDFIKRVIGVPGDTVSMSDGVVSVDGVALNEPYITHESHTDMDPLVVPPHSYFVLGDNRANSSDSRSWGFVPEDNIIGKAMFSYWPLSDFGGVGNRSYNIAALVPVSLPHVALPHLSLP